MVILPVFNSPRSRLYTNWSGRCMYGFGEIELKVWVPSLKKGCRSFPWRQGNENGAVALLGCQAFQRGFIRRNRPRDDEARSKSLEEKPSVPAGGVNCSLYAALELSPSFSVLGNLLRLVRNESSCSPWSFSAPSSEDLAWISNQVDPTRFFMIFHADHTCSWESRCNGKIAKTNQYSARKLFCDHCTFFYNLRHFFEWTRT